MSADDQVRDDLGRQSVNVARTLEGLRLRIVALEADREEDQRRIRNIESDIERLREDVAALLGRDDRGAELAW